MIHLKDEWLTRVSHDDRIGQGAAEVSAALASAVRLGTVAMTDYRKLNRTLGRPSGNKQVLRQIKELSEVGYLGTYRATRLGWSDGWPLLLPEEVGERSAEGYAFAGAEQDSASTPIEPRPISSASFYAPKQPSCCAERGTDAPPAENKVIQTRRAA